MDYRSPHIKVKGEKNTLERTLPPMVDLQIEGQVIRVVPLNDSKQAGSFWGLTRSLVANMVEGVSTGFTKELEIVGVGYRAELNDDTLTFNLGYSHSIEFKLPEGIEAVVDRQTRLTIKGADKELVGLTSARIRQLRKPEPYKGKGIKYVDEVIRRKVGKVGVKQM